MDYNIPKMPTRPENSNKGTFGKILNIAGSLYMPGAAYLSSVSALKIGAGYVELISDKNTLNNVAKHSPEIVLCPLNNISKAIEQSTIISIGCGLSQSKTAQLLFKKVLSKRAAQPLIIDADGLNILANINCTFDKNAILTPHPKEASRLLKCSLNDVLQNQEKTAKQIADKYNCIAVLKTHNTIVTDGQHVYKNNTGNSALSKAGSGDILCGMITGLVSQGMSLYDAAKLGVYLHGLTGDIAAKNLTEYSVLATELVRFIPEAVKFHLC